MGVPSHGSSGLPADVPELELDVRTAPASRTKPKAVGDPQSPLELAIDPRALVEERSQWMSPGALFPGLATPAAPAELAFDARLLADYGEPASHPMLSPLYAYRVLRRRRELRAALAGRRAEAERALDEAEDALVAFAEHARGTLEKTAEYSQAFMELRDAEEIVRSRDRVLAAEQGAQNARRSQVESRISNLEAELAHARAVEHAVAAELAEAQGALAREEARLKRAEIEVRAARQRPSSGEAGG
jgi:hypothetical protein